MCKDSLESWRPKWVTSPAFLFALLGLWDQPLQESMWRRKLDGWPQQRSDLTNQQPVLHPGKLREFCKLHHVETGHVNAFCDDSLCEGKREPWIFTSYQHRLPHLPPLTLDKDANGRLESWATGIQPYQTMLGIIKLSAGPWKCLAIRVSGCRIMFHDSIWPALQFLTFSGQNQDDQTGPTKNVYFPFTFIFLLNFKVTFLCFFPSVFQRLCTKLSKKWERLWLTRLKKIHRNIKCNFTGLRNQHTVNLQETRTSNYHFTSLSTLNEMY